MTPYSKLDQPEVTSLLFPLINQKLSLCPKGAEDVILKSETGEVLTCRYYLSSSDAPIVFFFPATDNADQDIDDIAQNYVNNGMNVFLASYAGCTGNSGSRSVVAMMSDSLLLFKNGRDWLINNGYSGQIFVMGQGLGSVATIRIVSSYNEQVKGMVIESGICTTTSFLKRLGLGDVAIDESEGFNVIEKIEKIENPTLIFHGAQDSIVPISEAENLQASSGARTKQFFVIPGAQRHRVSETAGELYFQSIKKFIDTVCGVNTWRQNRKQYRKPVQE